jgi:hypothetical protein
LAPDFTTLSAVAPPSTATACTPLARTISSKMRRLVGVVVNDQDAHIL